MRFSWLLAVYSVCAQAGVLVDRASLDTLLGGDAVTEGFENLPVAANDQADPDNLVTLDSTSITALGGPGLVLPGVQFISFQQIAWNGDLYFGLHTKTLISNSDDSTIQVNFTTKTKAFGLDLFAFEGYGDTAQVQILAADQTTIIATVQGITLPDSAAPIFFGYSDLAGIGGAIISQETNPWSPILDNVEFEKSHAVAEPRTLSLVAIALTLLLAGSPSVSRRGYPQS